MSEVQHADLSPEQLVGATKELIYAAGDVMNHIAEVAADMPDERSRAVVDAVATAVKRCLDTRVMDLYELQGL